MILDLCETKDDVPDTLLDQSFKFVINNLQTITYLDNTTKNFELREGVSLPSDICEKLVEVYQSLRHPINDDIINIFKNPEVTRLKRIKIRNSDVTDRGMEVLLTHNLINLDLTNCPQLTPLTYINLNQYSTHLTALYLGNQVEILPCPLTNINLYSECLSRGYIIKAPNLTKLTVHNVKVNKSKAFFPLLVKPLSRLTYLDLSGCSPLGDGSFLLELECLLSLVLYNVPRHHVTAMSESLKQLKRLRHLDISQSVEVEEHFKNPNQFLATLVESLPNLVSLDISGTNLAGRAVAEQNCTIIDPEGIQTDIPGLTSRVRNPFQFLGLYGTKYAACRRHDIPAVKIAGDLNEEQILNAAVAYIDRSEVLQKVMNDLYHLFRYENCVNVTPALSLVLEAMDRHIKVQHVQISGSATLFYIVKNKDKHLFNTKIKQRMVRTLLNGMSEFKDDETLMRNGCLTLCHFKIPQDVLFDYERLVQVLLFVVAQMEQESFVQRIGIYLLNSLACQVGGSQKQLLGDLGVIATMLELIKDRLIRHVCDDVLEVAWSAMWNVTDETPVNCERFLDGRGMDYFLGCLSSFPDKEDLLRNMMGLLGNVAEVKWLRPRLMTESFVPVFVDLLGSLSDGIEVSYNAAGVLAHMMSDGEEAWTVSQISRNDVLNKMAAAIDRWELSTERNINYRSFEPILGLLKVYHTPACQHWAVWALTNLTKVYPTKYCTLVEEEGGLELLTQIKDNKDSNLKIKELASLVIHHCQQYKEKGFLENDAQLDG